VTLQETIEIQEHLSQHLVCFKDTRGHDKLHRNCPSRVTIDLDSESHPLLERKLHYFAFIIITLNESSRHLNCACESGVEGRLHLDADTT
jgi:hypothetical protein